MKKQLRASLRQKRELLDSKELMSSKISELLLKSRLYENADTILLYASSQGEVSTEAIFKKALLDGKKVAFPVCENDNGQMSFYYVRSQADLEMGMYSILAPKECCEKYICEKSTICIVPGLSFDERGYRIGYGKGYYDRFLSSFDGISVGLCYEPMLSENLPRDNFDKSVDYLITDKKIYKIN